MKRIIFLTIPCLLLVNALPLFHIQDTIQNNYYVSYDSTYAEEVKSNQTYKNVILFIGDGMGKQLVDACGIYQNHPLTFANNESGFTHTAYAKTDSLSGSAFYVDTTKSMIDPGQNATLYDGTPSPYSSESLGLTGSVTSYTDSAAAGTALATGQLVTNSRIGYDQFGQVLPTVIDQAHDLGKKTGIVTTDELTGATPAAFLGHAPRRDMADALLESFANGNADLMIGVKPSAYSNKQVEYEDLYSSKGFDSIAYSIDNFNMQSNRMLGLLPGILPYGDLTPTLADLTTVAIDYLNNDNGFFLMVEGAKIDKFAHANQTKQVIAETLAFNQAVETARLWAGTGNDTLIIVTADHETGALTLNRDMELTQSNILSKMVWLATNHSRSYVRIDTFGEIDEFVEKYRRNFAIAHEKMVWNHTDTNHLIRYYLG